MREPQSAALSLVFVWTFVPHSINTYVSVGAALTYHAMYQAHSYHGYRFGDRNDNVRAESLYLFTRRDYTRILCDLGSGPTWSNRPIPAATSRINFQSQLTFGAIFGRGRVAYRFGHISNAGLAHHNPGINVNTILAGYQLKKWR